MSTQVLKDQQVELVYEVSGATFEDAVAKMFKNMRNEVFKQIPYPIIQMEAKEVFFDDVQRKKRIEKLLFLFMPKEKIEYKIKSRVVVNVKYIQYDEENLK